MPGAVSLRCSVATCPRDCETGWWWCAEHRRAVELHELVLCALARKVSRSTRLRIVDVISVRLEKLTGAELAAAAARIQRERRSLEVCCRGS